MQFYQVQKSSKVGILCTYNFYDLKKPQTDKQKENKFLKLAVAIQL